MIGITWNYPTLMCSYDESKFHDESNQISCTSLGPGSLDDICVHMRATSDIYIYTLYLYIHINYVYIYILVITISSLTSQVPRYDH